MRVENVKGAVWTVDELEFYKRRPQRLQERMSGYVFMLNVIHSILYLLIFSFLSSFLPDPSPNTPVTAYRFVPLWMFVVASPLCFSFLSEWMLLSRSHFPVSLFPSLHRTQYAPICLCINALFVTRMTLGLGGAWMTKSLCAGATWAGGDPGNILTLISSPLHSKPCCSFSAHIHNQRTWRLLFVCEFLIFILRHKTSVFCN